ncbi:MAG: hypothetical protein AAF567_06955 [Actinomycetota bacterium]
MWREHYDLAFLGVGAGGRAVLVASQLPPVSGESIALQSPDADPISPETTERLTELGFDLRRTPSADVPNLVGESLMSLQPAAGSAPRMVVDVSEMDRLTIGALVKGLASYGGAIEVDFSYVPAMFVPPSGSVAAAISGGDASWSPFPGSVLDFGLAPALILGLGYEDHVAVGTVERLDPSLLWTFSPASFAPEYDEQVRSANASLFQVRSVASEFVYPLENPEVAFRRMAELVNAVRDEHQVIIVPFGPKIFAAMANLIAAGWPTEVEVANVIVSAGSTDNAAPDERVSVVRLTKKQQ